MINLSPKLAEIAKLLLEGYSNRQIAHCANVSEATVKLHINRLKERCNCSNRTATALKLEREGYSITDSRKTSDMDESDVE